MRARGHANIEGTRARRNFGHEGTRRLKGTQGTRFNRLAKIDEVKQRCLALLVAALNEVEKRLPASMELFKGLSLLHPSKVLNATSRSPFNQLPLVHLQQDKASQIEEQYRKILHRDWHEESIYDGKVPNDTITFWAGILRLQNMLGKNPFKELATYALASLTNPVSNAVVERISSQVIAIKMKLRNRMSVELLNALVRIRSKLHFEGKCCRDIIVTTQMLELFNSEQMYGASTQPQSVSSSSDIEIQERASDSESDDDVYLHI